MLSSGPWQKDRNVMAALARPVQKPENIFQRQIRKGRCSAQLGSPTGQDAPERGTAASPYSQHGASHIHQERTKGSPASQMRPPVLQRLGRLGPGGRVVLVYPDARGRDAPLSYQPHPGRHPCRDKAASPKLSKPHPAMPGPCWCTSSTNGSPAPYPGWAIVTRIISASISPRDEKIRGPVRGGHLLN